MADSLSLTSFVMEHRLPWAEGNSAAPAGAGRFDRALIIDAGEQRACTIRSVSPLGATLTGEIATREGEELALELVTGQRPAVTVEWVGGGEVGVRFKQPIDVNDGPFYLMWVDFQPSLHAWKYIFVDLGHDTFRPYLNSVLVALAGFSSK